MILRLVAALLLAACHDRAPAPPAPPSPPPPPSSSVLSSPPAPPAPVVEQGPTPLDAPSPFIALDVPGFRPAVVGVPLGAREPRPLVVALHGNFDRPEWQCEVWRAATKDFPFVLCPRGVPRGDVPKSADRWEYASAKLAERELDAGVAALRERFGVYLVDGPIVFVGFSLGAIYGASIVSQAPARYPRIVLIEGGQAGVRASASFYKEGGGERVLLACGQPPCLSQSRALAKSLTNHGLVARVVDGGNIGHTYDGAISEGISREWPWLVEGLPGWAPVQVDVP